MDLSAGAAAVVLTLWTNLLVACEGLHCCPHLLAGPVKASELVTDVVRGTSPLKDMEWAESHLQTLSCPLASPGTPAGPRAGRCEFSQVLFEQCLLSRCACVRAR